MKKLSQKLFTVSTLSVLTLGSAYASTDVSSITGSVDMSGASAGILAIGVALGGLLAVGIAVRSVLGMMKRL